MNLNWSDFKTIVDTNRLMIYYSEKVSHYDLLINVGTIVFSSNIPKSTPRNTDQIQFEDTYKTTSNRWLETNSRDILNSAGTQGALTVGTTPIEVRVGATRLSKRKLVTLYNNSNSTLYWGFTNAVSAATGTPIQRNQYIEWTAGDEITIFIVGTTAGNNVRVTESF